jgi:hypothetical protein
MHQIYGECGYEIHRENGMTLLVNRRSWGLGHAMGGLTILAMVTAALGVLGLAGASDIDLVIPVATLFGLAAAFASVAGLILPVYKRRRTQPATEVLGIGVIDPAAGVLRGREHDVLAQLETIRVAVRIDW